MKFVYWARKRVARRAVAGILPNAKRLEQFMSETGAIKNAFCVWNCPSVKEVSLSPRAETKGDFNLYYHGNISPYRFSALLIEALAELPPEVHLHVVGYETPGHEGYKEILRHKALSLGIENRIKFYEPVSRGDLWTLMSKCHVGLSVIPKAIDDVNLKYLIGASNKSFDYFCMGLPILTSDISEWEENFVKPGYGLSCDPSDVRSIIKALRWFFDHREEARQMGERARQRLLGEWNYEKQFAPVLRVLEEANS